VDDDERNRTTQNSFHAVVGVRVRHVFRHVAVEVENIARRLNVKRFTSQWDSFANWGKRATYNRDFSSCSHFDGMIEATSTS
jgi:hypothetical protein